MDYNIYILAGGNSSRMQEDKATIYFQGKKMIEHIIEVASKFSTNIYILSNNKNHTQFGFECIKDIIPNCGAASGIDAMLHHTTKEKNILLPCDMPFVDENSIQHLINESNDFEITVPILNNYPEALMGVYANKCKEKWRVIVENKVYKLSEILKKFNTNFVDGNKMQTNNVYLFSNINTKAVLEKATTWKKK